MDDRQHKFDQTLLKSEDFLKYCQGRNLDPKDLALLPIFKNFIIDHGGRLEDCL